MENPQFVNLTFLKHFSSGNKETMLGFIEKFLETAPADVKDLERFVAENNWSSVRACAHSLKPQLSYMGITKLEGVINEIEHNAGEQKNLETLPVLLEELKKVCSSSYEELKQIITSLQ